MEERNWLETRDLKPRWSQVSSGIVNLILVFAAFLAAWRVIMDPRGILRLYTPMYGFAYVQWLLIAVLLTVLMMKFWPFKQSFMTKSHPVVKGLALTFFNLILVYFFVDIFYRGVVGNLGIPYFSPAKLTELGVSGFLAREYASAAVLMVGALTGLVLPLWVLHFNNWPANEIDRPAGYVTSFILTMFIVTYGYFTLLHPHFGILFYPWQKFMAAFPWWESIFGTLSGNFNLGWLTCWTVAIWLIEVTWEGYPLKFIKKQPWRLLGALALTFTLGMCLFTTFVLMQEMVWGAAVRGAKLTMAPDWRYLHAGEISAFMLVAILILGNYFKNWPTKFSLEVNILVRTFIVGIGSFVFYTLFYKFTPPLLGTQPGYAHPSQFPLAPLLVFIVLMLIHDWYMDRWPGEISQKRDVTVQDNARTIAK